MCAHHAAATVLEQPVFDPPLDPWLAMRRSPEQAKQPDRSGATVRDALRALASSHPDQAMLALGLRRVRALLDRQRAELRQRLADGAPADEIARAEARLRDGTVIGLCHLGRLGLDRPCSMVPPVAVLVRERHARAQPEAGAELLMLLPDDPIRLKQGLAVARFVARGLDDLGWRTAVAKRTVRGCLAETHLVPSITSDLSAARLLWGCQGLFYDLRAALAEARHRSESHIRRASLAGPSATSAPAPF